MHIRYMCDSVIYMCKGSNLFAMKKYFFRETKVYKGKIEKTKT